MEFVKQFLIELLTLVNAMSPYLLLGFFFAGVLKVWFPQKWIDRYMGKNNLMSVVNTALLGIPLPLCSCGVIPTGISFYKNGASKGSSVSFLISTPQTGVDSVLVTYSLLGLPFALVRVFVALVTGVLGGVFTNVFASADENKGHVQTSQCCSSKTHKKSGHSFFRVLQYGFNEFLMDIAKWLIIGILIAAGLSAIIPDDFFSMYLDNEILSMVMVLVASVPLYLCATASVPIAAVLMLKGLSPGAALILLMAGPATNAATITVIKKVFGNRTLFSYLFSIISGAFVFGLIINHFLPAEWFVMVGASHLHHQHELLPEWVKITSSTVLLGLIVYGYLKKYLKQRREDEEVIVKSVVMDTEPAKAQPVSFNASQFSFVGNEVQKTYGVEGMTCSHCKASVESNLKQLGGISSVLANPSKNTVVVSGSKLNDDEIKSTVEGLGYSFKGEL
ncbi:SO_0444 family Cu/Zn efflux transporter [Plebeiibacterium marinum]|uniref:SO_0444 family Cu/Zn efflux transporter n=1 Tax=Plebeiibacterium marinum TaxID=2992111 RepID=A0AAE3SJG6_9BACT|nr:SO_0444 family Cu/Zn efflux transporter [Plebeiobacterium marinum]MCW3805449.1 SO_0444 family Cu/Zn efflux transporter [Plebeiobacterium marinum]